MFASTPGGGVTVTVIDPFDDCVCVIVGVRTACISASSELVYVSAVLIALMAAVTALEAEITDASAFCAVVRVA